MKNLSLIMLTVVFIATGCKKTSILYVQDLDLSKVHQGWNVVHINKNLFNDTMSVNGIKYPNGFCTHAISEVEIDLDGKAQRFTGLAGVDDHVAKINGGSIEFIVYGDTTLLFTTGKMTSNMPAKAIDVNIRGYRKLILVTGDCGNGTAHDHGCWISPAIEYTGATPTIYYHTPEHPYILTPAPAETPRINGPKIIGATPGKPFLYRIPATGIRPMIFAAQQLPASLSLNPATGIITGKTPPRGEYNITLYAKNQKGETSRILKIVSGDKLALTPPMGWNSWNVWGLSVTKEKIMAAADRMISSGLADHGWNYINIDDGWEASSRNNKGELLANEKFGNMKELGDYIHSKGLKYGIYSSPGETTCGGFIGSYGYEETDARTWASWGVDFLKYDWCSYKDKAIDTTLAEYQKPYITMGNALRNTNRDIVYSLCQYGMGHVEQWGIDVGGNLWRTTGDITDTWSSLLSIGFAQDKLYPYAGPGGWNDPDMLVVGVVGWSSNIRPSRLSPNEQYTHISLWALLAAPMLLGCDLNQLDSFTLNLLTNDEVIDINQDILGEQARPVYTTTTREIWIRRLDDGSMAAGLFNISKDSLAVDFDFSLIKATSRCKLRDVWRQKDIGIFDQQYSVKLPRHGSILLKVTQQ